MIEFSNVEVLENSIVLFSNLNSSSMMHSDLTVSWFTLTFFLFVTILFALIESTKFQDYEITSKLFGKYRI